MVARSPAAFSAAVVAHPFGNFAFEPEVLSAAAACLAEAGLLVVGEPHGVRETPSVLYALASALGTRAVALEWSHEEMEAPLQEFLRAARSTSTGSGRSQLRLSSSAAMGALLPDTSRCSDDFAVRAVSIR